MTSTASRAETAAAAVSTPWSGDDPAHAFPVENPATGRVIATVAGCGPDEVDAAVRAADRAFGAWGRRTAGDRAGSLRAIGATLREHAQELAALESQEVGKPVGQALTDVLAGVAIFEMFSQHVAELPSAARNLGHCIDLTMLAPFGVVGAIIPFNWPPIHTAGKIAPAIAVGNTVVLKPPEQAPLTVLRMVELIADVLPADVVTVVPGTGPTGAALAGHPLVRKLSFTGAPTTGSLVTRTAADNLTPVVMELGGKNALVVFDDADLAGALESAVSGGYVNAGEACTAASRLLVHRSVHDRLLADMSAAVARLRVGNGADPRTHVGPLVSRAQQRRVLGYIDLGVSEGATIAAQAELPDDPALADGFWVAPTLFSGVRPDMRIAVEEIFGPVVVVIPFDTEQEAVEIANGTPFGLVAGVYTADMERAMRVSQQLEVGAVFLNNYDRATLGSPFGGTKHSGYGREHTRETLAEFSYTRTVRIPTGTAAFPRWPALDEVLPDRESTAPAAPAPGTAPQTTEGAAR